MATSGTPQSAVVGAAFAAPLVATVTTGGTPTANVSVQFAAPTATDGTFANGMITETDTTNASGVATSTTFTAGTTAGTYTVTALPAGGTTPANFALTNTAGAAATLTATSGSGQSATVSTAFASPLVATVKDGDGNGVQGISVTFTANAGGTGANGTFTSTSSNIEIQPTDASGNATVSDLVANATAGGFTVTASATGLTSVNYTETNTPVVVVTTTNYSFYLSGQEAINASLDSPNFYALAGAVTIDNSGNVTGGEQDYNDAFGITSPQPAGDTITGGTLTAVDAVTGQYTLTLVTNNASVGVAGTETFAVQFVNTNHALISQFDGTATSSGSMDLQTLPSTLSGGYAFTISGVDPGYLPIAVGGVFSISGTTIPSGTFDANDAGTLATAGPFSATISAADAFGRGTITGAFAFGVTPVVLNYYVVGPEVIRIIDVDTTDSIVGSAFGQGAGSFTNASLGSSVLALANGSNGFGSEYGALGQFTTNTGAATFSGVGDDNELDNGFLSALASSISGTYSIGIGGVNGYGSLTITGGLGGGSVSALGIYMTDPTLNLNDPNNSTGGGGALLLDLDASLAGGTGVVIKQTDPSAASFTGSTNSYAVGAQDFNYFTACGDCELDFLAQGTVAAGTLSGTGSLGDPFLTLGAGGSGLYAGSTFSGTPLADAANTGRYSMLSTNAPPNPLTLTVSGTVETPGVVMYQASGAQLFWLNYDPSNLSVFLGPLEQQGTLSGIPAARKPAAKTQTKRKL